ncbi:MAG: hypothetical protein QOI82_2931 [Actinomycetota bacterium]|jgi:hypothetical protein|nr:hypothetical protein [Actinomycetota bacterium]
MRRLLAVLLLAGGVLAFANPSYADAPTAQAWWNAANMGLAQPPDPPDVPPDGLLLQGGLSGPSAYAALSFTLPVDATAAALTLDVASTATQATAVQACPAKPGWKAVQGGPLADAPTYDCARSVAAALSADGKQLLFRDVLGLATSDGALSIALIPGDSDRVALAKPTATALTVQEAGTTAVAPPPPLAPPAIETAPVAAGAPPMTGVAPMAPGAAAPSEVAPAVAPPAQTSVAPARRPVQAAAKSRSTSTSVRLVLAAEALLTLISFGLLGVGPARALVRLTGVEVVAAERPRGIGRFSRERVGSAPSL